MPEILEVRDLGLVDYADGLRGQEVLADAVRAGQIPDQLVLLRHPPVVTLGRQGRQSALRVPAEELAARGIELFHVDRGGDATFHDPGQLVGYPILRVRNLPGPQGKEPGHAAALVWAVEELLLRTLAGLGVEAGRIPGLPGIWHQGRKIAALGMRIDRGVSRHGFALNLATAPAAWQVIVPCGLQDRGVVSLAEVLGRPVPPAGLVERISRQAGELLEREVHVRGPERASVQVVVLRPDGPPVLVLHRVPERGGFWQPVTGMIEPGESPQQAAAREVEEETGVGPAQLTDLGYVHSFCVEPGLRDEPAPPSPIFLREHSFAALLPAGARARADPREHDAAEWVGFAKAEERMRWSGNRRAIRLAATHLRLSASANG